MSEVEQRLAHLENLMKRHLGPDYGKSQLNTPHPDTFSENLPDNIIALWSGAVADIPSGWVLCDGNNGTPDLRDKFVVGAGNTYSPDDEGGNDSITLLSAQLPAHAHTAGSLAADSVANHDHDYNTNTSFEEVAAGSGVLNLRAGSTTTQTSSEGGHSHTISGNTGIIGSGQSIDIRPKYYALAFIMRKAA